ncbi:SDR family NAD(P)-dependent oxidoreductase [Streptomyces sp. NPDC047841]|uniref:SDR family oxidoreductase n=1 Tax=Streptomyces sp. NPDC047841 TaxID=3154708 RepID=UPI0034514C8F
MTGASSGIGAATARRLAQDGASVALVARRRHRLDQVAHEIAELGGRALVLQTDISDPESASAAVQDTLDRFGRLDIVVHSAGVMRLGSALHTTVEQWDRMIAVNVAGLVHVTHAAVPYLISAAATSPREVGDIVCVGSTAGRLARPGSSVYNLTKFGLRGFAESLRQELLVEQVRVSLVEPGTTSTELMDHLEDATRDAARWQTDGLEPLRPEDVADAIGYIVTRERRMAVNEMLVRSGDRRR